MLLWLSHRRNYRLRDLGFSMKDIAYDIVAELFSGEEEQCCAGLKGALTGIDSADDDALLSAFESILFKNVHQHLSRIFGEIDPLHQHLLRSLRGHIYRSDDVRTYDRLDGRWYCHRDTPESDLARPAMPIEMLRQQMSLEGGESSAPIADVFRSVLTSLRAQSEYRPAVLESDILQLTREALGMDYSMRTITRENPVVAHDSEVLGRILMRALDNTLPWIDEMYVEKKRLSRKEADCMLAAMRMYFNDLVSVQDTLGPYSYLRRCMPGLTHDRFRRSYRRKFEYILQKTLDEAYIRLGIESTLLR